MKKFFAIMVASVMVLALAVGATAMYSLDRIFVNENDRVNGDAAFGSAPPDGSDIEIEVGDSLYIIGWALNTDTGAGLDKIVYTIDDGDDIDCEGGYRDRPDVASHFGLDASAGIGAGFGFDNAADGGMMRLAGIEDLGDGTYEIAIKAIYTDGTEQVMEGPTGNVGVFTLIVGTGEAPEESSEESSDEEPVEESSDEEPVEESSDEEPVEESSDEEPVEESSDEEPVEESSEDEQGGEPTERQFGELDPDKLNIVIDGGLGRYEAKAGEEVDVKIELKGVTTLSSIKVTLTYDEKLSVAKKGNGKEKVDFSGMVVQYPDDATVMSANNNYPDDHKLILNWQALDDEINADSVFATITFIVAEDAEAGEFLPITAEVNANDVFNYDHDNNDDMVNVEFHVIDGGVDVIGEEPVEESSEEPVEESSEEPVEESSEEPVEESSEEPVEESSEEPAEESSEDEQSDEPGSQGGGDDNPSNPQTADAAIIAVAAVAAVALAGAVIGKKALKK